MKTEIKLLKNGKEWICCIGDNSYKIHYDIFKNNYFVYVRKLLSDTPYDSARYYYEKMNKPLAIHIFTMLDMLRNNYTRDSGETVDLVRTVPYSESVAPVLDLDAEGLKRMRARNKAEATRIIRERAWER